jgi:ATP synthase protein I
MPVNQRPARLSQDKPRWSGDGEDNPGWTIFGYLLAGMGFYGGLGWLAGHWTHIALLFPVGMLVGLVLGIVLTIYRFGRS